MGVAIELFIIIRYLSGALPFRRLAFMFAGFIGVCGISRIVDGYLLLTMKGSPVLTHELLEWAFDSLAAAMSLAMMAVLIPLAWNAMGGHWRIGGYE